MLGVFPLARAVRVYLREPVGESHEFLLSHVDGLAPTGPLRLAADVHRRLLEARRSIAESDGESCVWSPLIDHGELVGVLQIVVSPLPSRAGLDLLDGMSSPAAILLQSTRMREARAKRDRLEHDLELAAEIQRKIGRAHV